MGTGGVRPGLVYQPKEKATSAAFSFRKHAGIKHKHTEGMNSGLGESQDEPCLVSGTCELGYGGGGRA